MGYYITLDRCQIHIPPSLFPAICQSLLHKGFMSPRNMSGYTYADNITTPHFSWVDMKQLEQCLADDDLVGALQEFRFSVSLNDKGAIVDLMFDCKQGDEEILFSYMAEELPGIHRLDWSGEEGDVWRWLIKDNRLNVIDATITFDEEGL
jgi:hypothetical protein